jgi:D-glycero-D-manno-heptose 1,7-bisphosphate phosphatase
VFLDRDGVLNRCHIRDGRPYAPRSLAELEILPGVPEALQRLAAAGFCLIGATNQPDVSHGLIAQDVVEVMHRRLLATLPLDDILVCYSTDNADPRRKPNPGMVHEAAERFGIDLEHSFLIGDRWKDIEAGRRAGCRTIFIDYGYAEGLPDPPADFTTYSLAEAADWILRE